VTTGNNEMHRNLMVKFDLNVARLHHRISSCKRELGLYYCHYHHYPLPPPPLICASKRLSTNFDENDGHFFQWVTSIEVVTCILTLGLQAWYVEYTR
jgi:hypothetical protein